MTAKTRTDLLSKRESQVTHLAALGLTNEEIGNQLFITAATAKTMMAKAMRKVGALNRAHLVAIALTRGLIQVEPVETPRPTKVIWTVEVKEPSGHEWRTMNGVHAIATTREQAMNALAIAVVRRAGANRRVIRATTTYQVEPWPGTTTSNE